MPSFCHSALKIFGVSLVVEFSLLLDSAYITRVMYLNYLLIDQCAEQGVSTAPGSFPGIGYLLIRT